MLDQYIIYNQDFEVLICRICKAAVTGVHRHFARTHQEISLEDRQEIDEYVEGLILRPVEQVSIPTREIEAIEGIEIVHGFRCTAELECREVSGSERMMESHSRNFHDWTTSKGNTHAVSSIDILVRKWMSQSVQTIFSYPNIKYFPVRTTPTKPVTSDRLDDLISDMLTTAKQRDEDRHLERHRINNNESTKDTPWLNRTGWKRMFADRDMKVLVEKTSESLGPGEESLKELSTIVTDMIEEGYQG
jgi:hypothetical protein